MSVDFEVMWRTLQPIGRMASGGYRRSPYASAERECLAWFEEQAAARGLRLEYDGNGNVVAWWEAEGATGEAIVTGSHLDSVTEGG
ncbi:MAG: allantoate amidohydrolase, partial [Marmoricola sp.]